MNVAILLVSAGVAFAVTAVLGIVIIPFLRKLKFGQTILEDGPAWHKSKQGTPTMGGMMFIAGIVVALVAGFTLAYFTRDTNTVWQQLMAKDSQDRVYTVRLLAGVVMALASGFIGFMDDYIKVVKKRNLGLTVRQKTLLQLLVAAAYLVTLVVSGDTNTYIPFVGFVSVSQGFGLVYWPIALLFIYGFINAVNLTDGIDGLCTSVTMVICLFFVVFSTAMLNSGNSVLACCGAGGCAGFLVWNLKPAKVFMGDTGSLFLGGLVCALAFGAGCPIILLPVGIVYLIEALSDILQVAYYKKTKKRIFKMAPIHHHFEMCGWSENKIVLVFSGVTVIACAIAWLLFTIPLQ